MEYIDNSCFKTNSKDFLSDIEKILKKQEMENFKQNSKKNINFKDYYQMEKYLYNLISKIEEKKFLKTKHNENFLLKIYEKMKYFKNKEIPLFVDISIFVPENMEKVSEYLNDKKNLQNDIISKRKESFFTCDENFDNFEKKNNNFNNFEKEKNFGNFDVKNNFENQTQIFIPKINKLQKFKKLEKNIFRDIKNTHNDFSEEEEITKKNFYVPKKKKIKKSKIGFLLNSKKFSKQINNKIVNLKNFWNEDGNYPNLFVKKKLVKFCMDGNFYFDEVVDFSEKKIPS